MPKIDDNVVVYIAGGPDLCAALGGYNGHYWGTWRDRNVLNRADNVNAESVFSVFGPGFTEELPSFASANFRSLLEDFPNSFLVGQDRV